MKAKKKSVRLNKLATLLPMMAIAEQPFALELVPVIEQFYAGCRAVCERHGQTLESVIGAFTAQEKRPRPTAPRLAR